MDCTDELFTNHNEKMREMHNNNNNNKQQQQQNSSVSTYTVHATVHTLFCFIINNDQLQLNTILLLMSQSVVHCIMKPRFLGSWEESYT